MKTYNFQSVQHLAQTIQETPPSQFSERHESSASTEYDNGKFTRESAQQLAINGGHWTKGAQDLKPANLNTDQQLSGYAITPTIQPAVAGFMPNVQAHLSGDPESMYAIDPAPQFKKSISIGVNVARSWAVTQPQSANMGRAVLSLIQQLQLQGYSVSLDAVWHAKCNNELVSIATKIKQPEDHYSPASIAFAITSAAFCRNICWRFLETRPELENILSGYGMGVDLENPAYDVWIPYLYQGNVSKVKTEEKAQQWINELAINAITAPH